MVAITSKLFSLRLSGYNRFDSRRQSRLLMSFAYFAYFALIGWNPLVENWGGLSVQND